MRILVTRGDDCLGATLARESLDLSGHQVLVLDHSCSTCALAVELGEPPFGYLQADFRSVEAVKDAFWRFGPDLIAEVRSQPVSAQRPMTHTVSGTLRVASLDYWRNLQSWQRPLFRHLVFASAADDEADGGVRATRELHGLPIEVAGIHVALASRRHAPGSLREIVEHLESY